MNTKTLYILSALLGIFLGTSGATWLFPHSWLALIPWGIAGLLPGFRAADRKTALKAGAIYGFLIPVAFMLAGYNGPHELNRYEGLVVISLILGVIGILCGMALGFVGSLIRKSAAHSREENKPLS